MASLSFECPRCNRPTEADLYAPCATCCDELRATVRGEAHTVEAEYEPKMNVTPNAVALKDD